MNWYDDDTFWDDFHALLFDDQRIATAKDECEAIIDISHIPAGGQVLDLATGVGRHALAFAERGYAVTGVDRTQSYLDRATGRARELGVPVEWVKEDMRKFCRNEAYDLALNLYTSFGFFSDEADNQKVLKNLHQSLRPGGYLVMEMTSSEIIARDWQPRDWHRLADDAIVLEQRELLDSFSRARASWTLITKEGARRQHSFVHRLYSGSELAAMARATGFAKVSIYGNLEGAPYDQEAERLVLVACR